MPYRSSILKGIARGHLPRRVGTALLAVAVWMTGGCPSKQSQLLTSSVTPEQLADPVREAVADAVGSTDPSQRSHGFECVGLMARDVQVVRWLEAGLTDRVPAVRFAAAMATGDVQALSLQGELRLMLDDPSASVKMAAAYALEQMGDSSLKSWYDYVLAGEDPMLTAQACLILGKLGVTPLREDSSGKLWALLRKERQHPTIRLQAAEALARLGDKQILKTLLGYANSGFADDRILAIGGLQHSRDPIATSMLITLTEDPQAEVQLAAIRALGPQAGPDHRKLIRKGLNYRDPQGDEVRTERVRGLAILALGATATSDELPLLAAQLKQDNPYLRITATRATLDYLNRVE